MVKFIAGLILGALVVIFTLQNADMVTVRFLAWTVTISRAVMLFVVLGAGLVIGWMAGGMGRGTRRRR
ncbi:MAG: LapA family protein [Spirochaetales bacterium]|nr:LapA family protein [Spirochaetales bacterium]